VNIQEFIAELSENLMHAYGYSNGNFDLQLQIQVKELDADMAIPLGLIVNEVVTNAFKYAYKNVQHPSLYIVFNEKDNQLRLTVSDNGSVLTEKAWKQSASFGRQLIQSLTQQLQGTMQLTCNHHTAFNFTFPFKPALS
jgi:two-component sensor histidine kinase